MASKGDCVTCKHQGERVADSVNCQKCINTDQLSVDGLDGGLDCTNPGYEPVQRRLANSEEHYEVGFEYGQACGEAGIPNLLETPEHWVDYLLPAVMEAAQADSEELDDNVDLNRESPKLAQVFLEGFSDGWRVGRADYASRHYTY